MNILTAAGIAQINEPIFPQNGERIWGGLGVVTFNQASQFKETPDPDAPITPPDCPNCDGGIEPEPSVPPGANCDKKNISELKQVIDDYANQSFCDKEFPEVQFSTFIGYDKPPSDSTAKEIELRMLCPRDDCSDGTFWTVGQGTAGPSDEQFYEVLGYSDNCIATGSYPWLKLKQWTPCEIFERNKALLKQEVENFEVPSTCSRLFWQATFKDGWITYYDNTGTGMLTGGIIDEVAELVRQISYRDKKSYTAQFYLICNGSTLNRFDFKTVHWIKRVDEDTCLGIRCSGTSACGDNCKDTVESIFEYCCDQGS